MHPNWFVALPIPADWLPALQANAPEGLRWFQPTDVHLTIAFLGAMNPDKQQAVMEQMQQVVHASIPIRLATMIALPSERNFSAVSLKISGGNETISQLMEQWRGAFYQAAEARPDTRPPLPHITVARPRRDASFGQRKAILDWVKTYPVPAAELVVDSIAFYTWADDRSRQQFKIIVSRRLDAIC
jgi:2'-5' RNA ligase